MRRAPVLRIHSGELIVDHFSGGGGASLGIEQALGRSPDIAINHDRQAIEMHRANHPTTRHYCEDVWRVDPVEACRGRPVGLLWLSPDCKHHSKAKGGKPVDKRIRGLAWIAVKWGKAVRPRVICLENVEEFAHWGPLGTDGRPCPLRKGFTFRRFVGELRSIGYEVDWCELSAMDYGAPTTRKRLFLVARCDGQRIAWPEPTHGSGLLPYRTAAECIDWSLPTYSIFLSKEEGSAYGVKRPLAENTMRRIARGLQKFVIDAAEPFIVPVMHAGDQRVHSLDEPMRTITAAHRGDRALIAPYVAKFRGQSPGTAAGAPLHTITAGPKEKPAGAAHGMGLVAPILVPRYGEREGQEPRCVSVERPMPTIVPTQNGGQIVSAFLAKHNGGHEATGQGLEEAVHTVVARENKALVVSHLTSLYTSNSCGGQGDLRKPMKTVTAEGNHFAQVNAFLVAYYGNEKDGGDLNDPMRTVTARERFGLVTVRGEPYVIADIGMRMLAPRELYRAQGFPDSYVIDLVVDGKRLPKDAQVRMCGNSVCPPIAAAVVRAQFEGRTAEATA